METFILIAPLFLCLLVLKIWDIIDESKYEETPLEILLYKPSSNARN